MIFFTIARGRPRGGAGIVRQMPYLSPQLSPGGGGGWGISLIGALLDHRHSRHAFSRSKYMHRGCGTAHAQIRCHPATKSKVRPKKKYAHLSELQFEFLELSDQFEHQVKAVKGHGDKPVSIQRHLCH